METVYNMDKETKVRLFIYFILRTASMYNSFFRDPQNV